MPPTGLVVALPIRLESSGTPDAIILSSPEGTTPFGLEWRWLVVVLLLLAILAAVLLR
jgi:hypothetical protein